MMLPEYSREKNPSCIQQLEGRNASGEDNGFSADKLANITLACMGIIYLLATPLLIGGNGKKTMFLAFICLLMFFLLIYLKNRLSLFSKGFIITTPLIIPIILCFVGSYYGDERFSHPFAIIRLAILAFAILPALISFVYANAIFRIDGLHWPYKLISCAPLYVVSVLLIYFSYINTGNIYFRYTIIAMLPTYIVFALAHFIYRRLAVGRLQ